MNESLNQLSKNSDPLAVYDYIVNNADKCEGEMPQLIDLLRAHDTSGQFLASTVRFLSAVDRDKFEVWFTPLIECAIDRDREHKYIGSLLETLWGDDYMDRSEHLLETDDNFRRIFKRIYPTVVK